MIPPGKSIETESKFMIAKEQEEGELGVTANRYEFFFQGVMEMFWN